MTTASSYSDGASQRAISSDSQQNHSSVLLAEVERLPERRPALTARPYQLHGTEPQSSQPRLLLFPEAIDQIAAHAASDVQSEVGGVLLGAAHRHAGELYVEVRQALPVQSSDHGPIHFTFNADSWSQIHRDREAQYPGLDIVGWFHTHPGLGIFFSGDDVVVHSAAFVLPWHVALVADPLSKQLGGFAWGDGDLAPLPGLFEILGAEEPSPRLPWRLRKGQVWTESYVERMAARQEGQDGRLARWALFEPWHAIMLAVVALLVSLGILVGGLLPLSGQNAALRSMVSGLAERAIQEANADGSASCPDRSLQIYSPLPGEEVALGQEITLFGTADSDEMTSYRLDVRPAGEQLWWSLGTLRRPVRTGAFLSWDTSSFAPGSYQLRLSAANSSGETLNSPSPCVIDFELIANTLETP